MSQRGDGGPSSRARLPSVDRVLSALGPVAGGAEAVRKELDLARAALVAGLDAAPGSDELAARARARLLRETASAYPPVINATGIVLHTGLGRAPLAQGALEALGGAAGSTLLEVDPADGSRRHREHALLDDLAALTGAESATVVNNNAGALLLGIAALAAGRAVLVSRGELVEIGGGFRLPDVMALAGAPLVEVGTTNRTYASDYAARLTWETGLLLAIHTSNFRVEGFTHRPGLAELAGLARGQAVPLMVDIGSGLLQPAPPRLRSSLDGEPDARTALAQGADLVCFSGDKLLGGPQAGILVGRADLVARCRRHPLFRALRPDRLTLAALAATLTLHRQDPLSVPVLALLARSPAERHAEALALRAVLARGLAGVSGLQLEVVDSDASVGSGAAPARPLRSAAVAVTAAGCAAEELLARLRQGQPRVFARLWQGQVQLDVAALLPGDAPRLAAALAAALG